MFGYKTRSYKISIVNYSPQLITYDTICIKLDEKDKRSLRNRMVQTELLNVISLGQKESDHNKRLPSASKYIQWAPLNGITNNRINRLMESN